MPEAPTKARSASGKRSTFSSKRYADLGATMKDASPLLRAVLDEDEDAVAALLRQGADPNAGDEFNELPLVNASRSRAFSSSEAPK